MKIFVINLEKDADRREFVTGQLNKLDLDYEIVPAILGATLSGEDRLRHYDDGKAKWRYSRSLVPAEIGCALSHIKVYGKMISCRIERALVLEDDVLLSPDLSRFLSDCDSVLDTQREEVWLLSPAYARETAAGKKLFRSGRTMLPLQFGVYASSYVLTLAAAKALVAELYPVGDVADCWTRLRKYGVVDVFVAAPPLSEQKRESFGSSTADDYYRHIRRNHLTWLAYKARRTRCVLWELIYAPYRRFARGRRSTRAIAVK